MIDIIEFGSFPFAPSKENLKPRPDRRAIASVLPHESKMRVGELSSDGWRFETPWSEIFAPLLTYSATGRLAYIVREAGQIFVVLDDEAQYEYWDDISDELYWSSDGDRYSYVGKRGTEIFVASGIIYGKS